MTQKSTETRELVRRIKARKEFLDTIFMNVINLVCAYGTVTMKEEANCHTNVMWELRNFGGFTFETDLGQTDFGGDSVKVWYHPKQDFREGGLDAAYDKAWTPVLDVFFQTDYVVKHFSESSAWKKAFARVWRNQGKIVEQIKKNQDEAKTKLAGWREEDEKRNELLRVAKKLGIVGP